MVASQTIDHSRPEIVILGTVPPPVTGMTLVTKQVVRALQQVANVNFFNWSTGISKRGLRFRATRVLRIVRSLFWLVRQGPVFKGRIYVVANSKTGLYLTAVIAWLARRLGYTVYLHHHTYYYIDEYDWRMAWIDRTLGQHGVHVVHTPQMADDFRAVYPTQCPFAFIYPSVVASPLGAARESVATPIRLGHLSNLQLGKGLDLVLDTFHVLRKSGQQARLVLAGTFLNQETRRVVEEAIETHSGLIEYIGPVYDADKTRFFARIDCFVFPTRSESWGIVLHEAMAAGVPVITYDRGCTRTVVGNKAGLVIDRDADFAMLAARQVEHWAHNPHEYRAASQAAIEQADRLQREGQRTLDEFVALVLSPTPISNGLNRPA